jgi:hypothetical protein
MDRWLDGDLSGLDPRTDAARLRDVAVHGLTRGIDPAPLVAALSVLHPLALAELALRADAPTGPVWTAAVVSALPALETVVSPGGLYARVCEMAGSDARLPLDAAFARHPTAAWLPALARRFDALDAHLDAAGPLRVAVARLQCGAGFPQAVARRVAEGDVGLLAAVAPADREAVVASAVDHRPDGPAIAALAGLLGPAVFGARERIAARCRTEGGRGAALDRLS